MIAGDAVEGHPVHNGLDEFDERVKFCVGRRRGEVPRTHHPIRSEPQQGFYDTALGRGRKVLAAAHQIKINST